jgi:endonuclease III-like uncharacterized protein
VYQTSLALDGYTLRLFTQTLGWSKEDTDAMITRVEEELQQMDLQLYSYFRLIISQKPAQSGRSRVAGEKTLVKDEEMKLVCVML